MWYNTSFPSKQLSGIWGGKEQQLNIRWEKGILKWVSFLNCLLLTTRRVFFLDWDYNTECSYAEMEMPGLGKFNIRIATEIIEHSTVPFSFALTHLSPKASASAAKPHGEYCVWFPASHYKTDTDIVEQVLQSTTKIPRAEALVVFWRCEEFSFNKKNHSFVGCFFQCLFSFSFCVASTCHPCRAIDFIALLQMRMGSTGTDNTSTGLSVWFETGFVP